MQLKIEPFVLNPSWKSLISISEIMASEKCNIYEITDNRIYVSDASTA